MKILCIGNSFSSDATRYLEYIAEGEMKVRNLFIGGCNLEMHCNNIENKEASYSYERDAVPVKAVTLAEALEADDWDYVTLQQSSPLSGKIESYEPYLTKLIEFVKSKRPSAEIVFHETWAFESNCTRECFADYNNDRKTMEDAIIAATAEALRPHGLPMIKVGEVIRELRRTKEFNFDEGGLALTRDGFHLSMLYGRYTAALAFYRFFTGNDAQKTTYMPDFADEAKIAVIRKVVNKII